MAAKWGPNVQDAIAEAVARGERHSVALAKLHVGTLPGIEGPVPMPPRSSRSTGPAPSRPYALREMPGSVPPG